MALFIRKQDNENFLIKTARNLPVATEGPEEEGMVRLIVGLGNPEKQYDGTRHNIGFEVLDAYHKKNSFPAWKEKEKFKALVSEDFVAGKKIILAKPTTYMNLSGNSVNLLKEFYKIPNVDILVVHDEIDLPFGTIKRKQGGGSAGNNGIKNIVSQIKEDFQRLRVGVKNNLLEKMDPADFVLSKFSSEEKKQLDEVIKAAVERI